MMILRNNWTKATLVLSFMFSLFSLGAMAQDKPLNARAFESADFLFVKSGLFCRARHEFTNQRENFGRRDTWQAALGKGAVVGVLTAIPLPLASLTTFLGGMLGTGKALFDKRGNNPLLISK